MTTRFRETGETGTALVIDLDRDLLRGGLAAEAFRAALGRDWRRALASPGRARRPGLDLDIARLPYDPDTLARCRAARAAGTRTVLVTTAPPELAGAVAAHLGCFDASEGGVALPGPGARRSPPPLGAALRALRPHQWVKNVLVFLPLVAAHAFDPVTFGWSLVAFLGFGLIASAVYLLNDLADLEADRRHPTKRDRPFASGRLPLAWGAGLIPALLAAGFGLAALAGPLLLAVMLVYAIATTAYSLRLKGTLGADILVLAVLYTLRIIAGAAATGIVPSIWLLTFSIFLFFALGAVKRLSELVQMEAAGGPARAAGRAYGTEDRPVVAMIATAAGFLAVLVLALYIESDEVRAQYDQPQALWGICLALLYWISRTVLLAHRGQVDQDPVVFALTDRVSQATGAAIALLFAAAILL